MPRKAPFPDSTASYSITDGDDFRVSIDAKDFPHRNIFRVYRVHGDITQPERLKQAIINLLTDRGVEHRHVEVKL